LKSLAPPGGGYVAGTDLTIRQVRCVVKKYQPLESFEMQQFEIAPKEFSDGNTLTSSVNPLTLSLPRVSKIEIKTNTKFHFFK